MSLEVGLLLVNNEEQLDESSAYVNMEGWFDSCGYKLRGIDGMKCSGNQYECALEFFADAPYLLDLIMDLFPFSEEKNHVTHNEDSTEYHFFPFDIPKAWPNT